MRAQLYEVASSHIATKNSVLLSPSSYTLPVFVPRSPPVTTHRLFPHRGLKFFQYQQNTYMLTNHSYKDFIYDLNQSTINQIITVTVTVTALQYEVARKTGWLLRLPLWYSSRHLILKKTKTTIDHHLPLTTMRDEFVSSRREQRWRRRRLRRLRWLRRLLLPTSITSNAKMTTTTIDDHDNDFD